MQSRKLDSTEYIKLLINKGISLEEAKEIDERVRKKK